MAIFPNPPRLIISEKLLFLSSIYLILFDSSDFVATLVTGYVIYYFVTFSKTLTVDLFAPMFLRSNTLIRRPMSHHYCMN